MNNTEKGVKTISGWHRVFSLVSYVHNLTRCRVYWLRLKTQTGSEVVM